VEGKFYYHLFVGGEAECSADPPCVGAGQPRQSGKNKDILDYFEETDSELKIPALQEKSSQPKSSIPALRLALGGKGSTAHTSAAGALRETYLQKQAEQNCPHPKKKVTSNTLSQSSP
jgi:hypothetical protein